MNDTESCKRFLPFAFLGGPLALHCLDSNQQRTSCSYFSGQWSRTTAFRQTTPPLLDRIMCLNSKNTPEYLEILKQRQIDRTYFRHIYIFHVQNRIRCHLLKLQLCFTKGVCDHLVSFLWYSYPWPQPLVSNFFPLF